MHRVINEYADKLGFFEPIKEIHVEPGPFVEAPTAQAYAELDKEIMKITMPEHMIDLLITAKGHQCAHELGHLSIDEALQRMGYSKDEAHIRANDLIHRAANTETYIYKKTYFNKLLAFRYGVFIVRIRMFDVAALVRDSEIIMRQIKAETGPVHHKYWSK